MIRGGRKLRNISDYGLLANSRRTELRRLAWLFESFRLELNAIRVYCADGAGVWPSGKASVFGIVYRRFESYHPSQISLLTKTRLLR